MSGAFRHTGTQLLATAPSHGGVGGGYQDGRESSTRELFEYLETNAAAILAGDEAKRAHAVLRCSAIKGRVVSLDEREMTGLRARLNLGHTLGHAVENAVEYTGILHGEAVAIGMSFAAHLAEGWGQLRPRSDSGRLIC